MRKLLVCVALLLAARPAAAQNSGLTVRAAGIVGFEHFTASQTFKGIFDSANGVVYGGGADIVSRHLFFRVDVTHFGRTGERAFAFGGQVFRLGIPLKVSITPVVGSVGYRGMLSRNLAGYIGGGAGAWHYAQSGDDPNDADSFTKPGYVALAGVEWRLQRLIALGFEGQYTAVPNAIGKSGLSADLGEKDLGGGVAAIRVIVGR